jgi:RNA polymerase sigma-70 factor (ECF subfamily)
LPFSSWLYRIAHNQVVDYLRKKSKRATVPLDESMPSFGDGPERAVEQKIAVEGLAVAAKKLTSAQQEVISLRFAAELSIAEVAEVMGKSQGAVKALQHSAIVALRKLLSPGVVS